MARDRNTELEEFDLRKKKTCRYLGCAGVYESAFAFDVGRWIRPSESVLIQHQFQRRLLPYYGNVSIRDCGSKPRLRGQYSIPGHTGELFTGAPFSERTVTVGLN